MSELVTKVVPLEIGRQLQPTPNRRAGAVHTVPEAPSGRPGVGHVGVAGVGDGGDVSGGDVVHVTGDAHLRWQRGCGEQPCHVGADRGMRVEYGRGFEHRLGASGYLGELSPEVGVGEEAGSALGVVDDRDFEECLSVALAAQQLFGE